MTDIQMLKGLEIKCIYIKILEASLKMNVKKK